MMTTILAIFFGFSALTTLGIVAAAALAARRVTAGEAAQVAASFEAAPETRASAPSFVPAFSH